jgi:hypothetical protein
MCRRAVQHVRAVDAWQAVDACAMWERMDAALAQPLLITWGT